MNTLIELRYYIETKTTTVFPYFSKPKETGAGNEVKKHEKKQRNKTFSDYRELVDILNIRI